MQRAKKEESSKRNPVTACDCGMKFMPEIKKEIQATESDKRKACSMLSADGCRKDGGSLPPQGKIT